MPPASSEPSEKISNSQHRSQLIWTGTVGVILGIVALQQSTSTLSSAVAFNLPEAGQSEATGIPALDSALGVNIEPALSEQNDLASVVLPDPNAVKTARAPSSAAAHAPTEDDSDTR